VLCYEREAADADIAEGWARLLDAHPRRERLFAAQPELRARYTAIVARYGPLFKGRRLACRGCLGVRYGEVKKNRRRPSPARDLARNAGCAQAMVMLGELASHVRAIRRLRRLEKLMNDRP